MPLSNQSPPGSKVACARSLNTGTESIATFASPTGAPARPSHVVKLMVSSACATLALALSARSLEENSHTDPASSSPSLGAPTRAMSPGSATLASKSASGSVERHPRPESVIDDSVRGVQLLGLHPCRPVVAKDRDRARVQSAIVVPWGTDDEHVNQGAVGLRSADERTIGARGDGHSERVAAARGRIDL